MNRYIVATHSFLVAVDLDSRFRIVRNFVIDDPGHHYGIALAGDRDTFIAKRDDEELMVVEAQPPFSVVAKIPLQAQVGYIHQIAAANGGIYLTNTTYNSLVFIGLDGKLRHELTFGDRREDVNHINSVYPCGDQILVLLHNQGRGESEMCVLEHDIDFGFRVQYRGRLWHTGCHNVFIDDAYLYYNASQDQALVAVDLERQEIAHCLSLPGHVKGMSLHGGAFLVGVSEAVERDKRSTARGQIAVIDKESMELRAMVDVNFSSLPHPIGNINEIRCISGGEQAHHRTRVPSVDWAGVDLNQLSAAQTLRRLARRQFRRVRGRIRGALRR